MTQYTVEISEEEEEPALYDVVIEDTFNPFGNFAILSIKDQGGERYEQYPRGTRVDIYEDQTGSTSPRFSGFVVERDEYEENGADILEVECYTFDQFLRGTKVSQSTEGLTLFEALEQIVEEDTPVTWNPNKVSIGDPQTLTRDFRGETVESVIIELAYKSESEEFGVDDNLDFFFRERETTSSPRDIDNTQWFYHDIPEEGKEAVNQVTIWFNGGNESVTIDRGDEKLDTQESLGLDVPPENTLEKTFKDITDLDDARDKGEQILEERAASQTGEIVTYGLEGARPGDLINVEIESRGIDDEFVIAGLNYEWSSDETTVTIIRKSGYQDEVLVRLADSVEKVEMRPADRDAIENRVTETNVSASIDIEANVAGRSFDRSRFVNAGRNKLRDAWRGQGPINITEIAVGSDGSNLSRSNGDLEAETQRVSVTESLEGSDSVSYSASVTQTDVEEVGLFDADGDLITRIVGGSEDVDNTIAVNLTVRNETEDTRGLFTNSGVEAVRDSIADNSPKIPTQYAYGSGGTDPTTADTALLNQLTTLSLDELLLSSGSSTDSFSEIADIEPTDPITLENGAFELLQTCDTRDPFYNAGSSDDSFVEGDEYSRGNAVYLVDDGHFVQFEVSHPYDLPAEHVGISARVETVNDQDATFSILWDDQTIAEFTGTGLLLGWDDYGDNNPYGPGSGYLGEIGDDILAGDSHSLRFEVSGSNPQIAIDVVACLYDTRFGYTFPNPGTENNGDTLVGPELYPDVFDFNFETINTRRDVTQARIESSWTNTDNNQYIQLSNDGTAYLPDDGSQNNTSEIDVNFTEGNTTVDTRVGLSRYPVNTDPQTEVPKYGYNGQSIEHIDLYGNIDAIISDGIGTANLQAIVSPGTITNETIREAGQLSDDDTLLTRSVMAEFDVTESMRVVSSESISWNNP